MDAIRKKVRRSAVLPILGKFYTSLAKNGRLVVGDARPAGYTSKEITGNVDGGTCPQSLTTKWRDLKANRTCPGTVTWYTLNCPYSDGQYMCGY